MNLSGSMVASSFGKLVMKESPREGVKEEDLAIALLMMITNNIGISSSHLLFFPSSSTSIFHHFEVHFLYCDSKNADVCSNLNYLMWKFVIYIIDLTYIGFGIQWETDRCTLFRKAPFLGRDYLKPLRLYGFYLYLICTSTSTSSPPFSTYRPSIVSECSITRLHEDILCRFLFTAQSNLVQTTGLRH